MHKAPRENRSVIVVWLPHWLATAPSAANPAQYFGLGVMPELDPTSTHHFCPRIFDLQQVLSLADTRFLSNYIA